jgi:hypothetical protein
VFLVMSFETRHGQDDCMFSATLVTLVAKMTDTCNDDNRSSLK